MKSGNLTKSSTSTNQTKSQRLAQYWPLPPSTLQLSATTECHDTFFQPLIRVHSYVSAKSLSSLDLRKKGVWNSIDSTTYKTEFLSWIYLMCSEKSWLSHVPTLYFKLIPTQHFKLISTLHFKPIPTLHFKPFQHFCSTRYQHSCSGCYQNSTSSRYQYYCSNRYQCSKSWLY